MWLIESVLCTDAASSGPEKAREMELPSAQKKPAAAPAADDDDDAGAAMDMEQFVQSGMLDTSDNVRILSDAVVEMLYSHLCQIYTLNSNKYSAIISNH